MLDPTVKLRNVPEPDIALAERLFDILAKGTADTAGVTREAYGKGEQFAHDLVAAEAKKVGLPVTVDAAGNMYIRLAGSDPIRAPSSSGHISTPFRWVAISMAPPACSPGLPSLSPGKRQDSASPMICGDGDPRRREQLVPAFLYRLEIGARIVPASALDVKRSDTGRTLAEHMKELGFKPDAVRAGEPQIKPDEIRAYIEMHIEQGTAS